VLTIVRLTEDQPFDVEVVRDRIEIPTIESDTVGGDIAYVRLNTFNENAGDLVRDAVKTALAQNPSALIFDLRGNPGGLLRQAVETASVFLPKGERVLIERFSDGKEEIYVTEDEPVTTDLPIVVLVNEGSASASEIVAGAIQDMERGQLVGATTYGKAVCSCRRHSATARSCASRSLAGSHPTTARSTAKAWRRMSRSI
jgi:carboxyl-terminal processing protease